MPIYRSQGAIVRNSDGALAKSPPSYAQLSDNEWLFNDSLADSKGSDDLTNNGLTYGYVTDGGAAVTTYGTESVWFTGPANGLMEGNADKQLVISTRVRITGDTPNDHDRGIVSEGATSSRVMGNGRYRLGYQPNSASGIYYWNLWMREGDGSGGTLQQVAIANMGFHKWFDLVLVINPGVSARLWCFLWLSHPTPSR